MSQILLVEDDKALAMGIEFTLNEKGYIVHTGSTLEEGKKLYDKESIDLILLDINLPDGSGYDLCRYIRTSSDVPIVFLTALDEEVNIVLGLDIGGDDYITKPFRVGELLSRIRAILRRTSKNDNIDAIYKSGDLNINTATAHIDKNGEEINLTALEYKLLLIFINKSQQLLKREEILKALTEGEEAFFDENTLSVYIKRLREKIEDNQKDPQYIITQRGLGYRWQKEVIKE
ncbi:response regulator transcription factor [Clostridium sp. D2Q-11]|uniref:Response regulator transcription factor n=1 Tax=Anaeromonas frigoriresistens TaxID=2683708 RepID=A0A942Z6D9_9FIRM|nr:response regulator transcription factor [Anaeromonas frigoriresistens]MBS4538371.1 response regulator transcription factor [Anaeromonas frigoriresistens]